MAGSNSGYQWYQTESTVCVLIPRKGADPSALRVAFSEQIVEIFINDELSLQLNLAQKIDPQRSLYKTTTMNIELKMAKLTSSSWSCLEGVPPSNQAEGEPKKHGKSYKDWDAVAKEADEIEEGDPLNSLFQKIFKDADDDTRRAMIKSFVSPAFATG
ncbi:unnamed protein product [Mesocestoides corti]|uniref:CS domain-containing protein n=1 Tax=Mesocestoides corti TaxID=53468 RepID=A0A0R3UBY8_MESCO|nr:unnamed protein product [Mesocestoides corti]